MLLTRPARARIAGAALASIIVMTGCSGKPSNQSTTTAPIDDVTGSTTGPSPTAEAGTTPASAEKREFLFQIDRYDTENQGGQTLNLYFYYRYDAGLADADIPNFVDLRTKAIEFMDAVDASQNPFWEVLNQQLCGQLHSTFPLEAISCQLQVYPDNREGLPYEPGFHSSIDTIGDIQPLAIVGPVTTG